MIRSFISRLWSHIQIDKHRRYVRSQMAKGMHIGNNVMICPGVKFDPPHSFLTSIGDNCIIAPDVRFLNHDASLFGMAGFARIGRIEIGANCFIGAGAILLPGINIGPDAIVGAGAVVAKDVAPNTIAAGNPARMVSNVSEFIQRHRASWEDKKAPSFPSDDFYPRLGDPEYRKKVLKMLVGQKGYTIGGDHNLTFHFNRTNTPPTKNTQ